jgi:putative ABC transport system permease protein
MRLITVIRRRLRALFTGRRIEADAREELQQHHERQVEMHCAAGMSEAEARRAAAIEVGGLRQLQEACRDARGLAWWDALRADLRYALRQVRRWPGYSSAAILTLALGIGATSAIFTVADAVVLRPLPYPEPERLYALYEVNSRSAIGRTRAAALNFLDWRRQSGAFSAMGAHVGTGFTLTGRGDPEFVLGQLVTPELLDVLKVPPAVGRTFMPHEAEAGTHRVVILTHRLWQRHFGADPGLVGRTTTINGQPYQIIGIMPPAFAYPSQEYELMTPFVTRGALADSPPVNRVARYLRVVARLGNAADAPAARRELDVIGARLAAAYADTNENVTIGMTPLADETIGDAGDRLIVLVAAVGLVLLIACVNVAGLAIARGSARGRELAVRAAIGASRGRLVCQLATETLVIFAIGGGAGLLLAALSIYAVGSDLPSSLPRAHEIALDWRFAVSGAAVTLASGLLFSTLPALAIARRGPGASLAGARVVSPPRATQHTRGLLIVAQLAAACVLLAGAALAWRSFEHVRRADAGFDAANAMTFSFVMRDNTYPAGNDLRAFSARVSEALASTPGVEAVGLTTHLPLSDQNFENGFTVDGSPVGDGQDPSMAGVRGITGHYRAAIGARLIAGRDLLPSDTNTSPFVAVVTAEFARRYVRAADPVGVRLKMGGADSEDPWRTIVGVIADIRHVALDRAPRPEVWLPYAQLDDGLVTRWLRGAYAVARTSIEPDAAAPSLRTAMRALDPELPLRHMRTLRGLAHASTAERRLETWLLSAFGTMATILAAVGVFGLLAFHVAQHVQEFGVRLALGATPSGLMRLIVQRGARLLAIGLLLGIPGALLMGRSMSSLLYGVEPADPIAIGGAVALLSIATLAGCVVPARRAMKTDPIVALRRD